MSESSVPAFDFDLTVERRGSGSLKWDKYAGRDVIPLWVADMDFVSPPAVLDALLARVRHGVFGYSRPTPGVTDAVVSYLHRAHGVSVDPEWIVWLPGCVPALSMACRAAALNTTSAEVLTCTPVYPPFLHVHRDASLTLKTVPLVTDQAGRYGLDFAAMEAAIRPETRVLLFCNPHNPVGRVFTRSDVERVSAICGRHGLVFCSDEIHCDLILDEQRTPHFTALRLEPARLEQTIVLMAASKTYNIAGLACAFAVIPNPGLRQRFVLAGGRLLAEISPLSFAATEAAYRDGEPWRQALLAYLRRNRDFLADKVRDRTPQIVMSPLEATYLAWLDVRNLNLANPASHFESFGLGLEDGKRYGVDGFVRWNFGCTHKLLQQAWERFESAAS